MKRSILSVSVALACLAIDAVASDANFDSFTEGVIAPTFTDGGITFSNLDCDLGLPSYSFSCDEAWLDLQGTPGFTQLNCLGFQYWLGGASAGLDRVLSFEMTTGQIENDAHIDLWEDGSYPANTISLQAYLGGVLVATDTQAVPGTPFQHHYLSISGVQFDRLRVQGAGPSDDGIFLGIVDSVHIGTASFGTIYCAGDGTGTGCPCGNTSALGAGEGCTSSLGVGAKLRATGVSSLASDTLVLEGVQMPNAPCLYFQGTTQTSGGLGAAFGDGLRCAGGSIVRMGAIFNTLGMSHYPSVGQQPVSVRGQVTTPGVRDYQVWYRNAAPFCTPFTFNLTNGVEITWVP